MGVFLLKKVENRWCFFVKKWNMGVFCKKKWTFPQRRVHYVQYQYFLSCILFIWGAYAPNAPPAHTGLICNVVSRFFRSIKIIDILNRSTAEVPVMIIHYTRTFSDDNQVLDNYFLYS